MIYRVVLLLAIMSTFVACKKRDIIKNGAVETNIVSPAHKASISPNANVELKLDFLAKHDLTITDVFVHLIPFTEGRSTLEKLESLPTQGENTQKFERANVNKSEFTLKETLDLSSYAAGTCFVVYSGVENSASHSEGTEVEMSYFCLDK